jgi:hypothetical protein
MFAVSMLGVGLIGMNVVRAAGPETVFKPATLSATQGFKTIAVGDTKYFVAPDPMFSGSNVQAASADGGALQLTVGADIANRVSAAMKKTERLAIFVGGTFVNAPIVRSASDGKIVLAGLSSFNTDHLVNVLGNTGAGAGSATMSVVTNQTSVNPGDMITVDVYLSGAADLKAYQVRANATSGQTGKIAVAEMVVDKERSNYVFGTGNVIDAVDNNDKRLGAVIFEGSVNVGNPLYLGSFTFQTPEDIHEAYVINVEVGEESFLRNSTAEPIEFRVGAPVVVSAGTPNRLGQPERSGK